MLIDRRAFLNLAAGSGLLRPSEPASDVARPNIILIFCDDLGYGDLGCYGSRIPTPNLDRIANEGVRFRQFYSAAPVCSPSRAALMTGRYPTRVGVPDILFPDDHLGLAEGETTIAEVVKSQGYKTMALGKWHLGSDPQYVPTRRGFDQYFGLLWSTDMPQRRLMRNNQVVEDPVNLEALAQRYANEACRFLDQSQDTPFFLYFAPATPHIPLAASSRFRGTSRLGLYGDAVAELDWSVGAILDALARNGQDANTLIMFSSDHGPWYQGSAGRLRGRKGETWEGGVRTPFIARFPGQIPAGLVANGAASAMDLLPTVASLTGAGLPLHRVDGVDIWPLMTGEQDQTRRNLLLYFDSWHVQCARLGRWKAHFARYNVPPWLPDPPGGRINLPLSSPELYDLEADPEESYDCAGDNPAIVADIRQRLEAMLGAFPAQVQNAWRDTQAIPVEGTPAGAPPKKR